MTDQRSGGLPLWLVIATLLLLPILAFLGIELLQRYRFERTRESLVAAMFSLDGTRLGRNPAGIVFLPDGTSTGGARYQMGLGQNLEQMDRWILWSLSAKSDDPGKPEEPWSDATVIVMLRQNRKGILLSPRVSLIMPKPPHPAIAARIDSLLKARGIEYELADALP